MPPGAAHRNKGMKMSVAFKTRLQTGEIALGCNVRFSRSAEIGAMLAACGFHWMMLDYEHSPASPHLAQDIALGALRAGVLPLARPSSHDPREIAGLLSNGALGLIVPHVENAAEARAVAQAARFAPRGTLSVPGTMAHFGYDLSLVEACTRFNEEVVVIAMIESRAALAEVDAIADVPGMAACSMGDPTCFGRRGCRAITRGQCCDRPSPRSRGPHPPAARSQGSAARATRRSGRPPLPPASAW